MQKQLFSEISQIYEDIYHLESSSMISVANCLSAHQHIIPRELIAFLPPREQFTGDTRPRIDFFQDMVIEHCGQLQNSLQNNNPHNTQPSIPLEILNIALSLLRHNSALSSEEHYTLSSYYNNKADHNKDLAVKPAISPKSGSRLAGRLGLQQNMPQPEISTGNNNSSNELVLSSNKNNIPEGFGEISRLYRSYLVLFVTLLGGAADKDHKSRHEELDHMLLELSDVKNKLLSDYNEEYLSLGSLEQVLIKMGYHDLVKDLEALYALRQAKTNSDTNALLQKLNIIQQAERANKDTEQEIADLEHLMMQFMGGQMIIFQESRQIVEMLARKGIEITGHFMEEAKSRMQGRGQGNSRGR